MRTFTTSSTVLMTMVFTIIVFSSILVNGQPIRRQDQPECKAYKIEMDGSLTCDNNF